MKLLVRFIIKLCCLSAAITGMREGTFKAWTNPWEPSLGPSSCFNCLNVFVQSGYYADSAASAAAAEVLLSAFEGEEAAFY